MSFELHIILDSFNSYNYNFFRYSFFLIKFSLKLQFQLIKFSAFRL